MGCTHWHQGLQALTWAAGAPQAGGRCTSAVLWQVEGCKWCCSWEACTPVLCEWGGSRARTSANSGQRSPCANGLSMFASLVSQIKAPCHQRQGPSVATPMLAACGEWLCEDVTSTRHCQSYSEQSCTSGHA